MPAQNDISKLAWMTCRQAKADENGSYVEEDRWRELLEEVEKERNERKRLQELVNRDKARAAAIEALGGGGERGGQVKRDGRLKGHSSPHLRVANGEHADKGCARPARRRSFVGAEEAEAEEDVVEVLTRQRDEAKAELAAYVLEEVARRKKEEGMRATNEISQRNYSYGGVLHQGNLELLVQKTNDLQRELEQKTASEKSLEDAVRQLRDRETMVRLELAERERSDRESRARERVAWRARARELIRDLGEVGPGLCFGL